MAINPIYNFVQLIRSLTTKVRPVNKVDVTPLTNVQQSVSFDPVSTGKKKRELNKLEKKIVNCLSEIRGTPNDNLPEFLNIFIKEVLVWEFGEKIITEPKLLKIADEIINLIVRDDEIKVRFIKLHEAFMNDIDNKRTHKSK